MTTFEFVDDEYKITIAFSESENEIYASTEFDFIKYESDPVKFKLDKFRKIHDRIKYSIVIERTYILLSYKDADFDFELEFKMQKETMDAHKETLTKIKKASTELNQLKKEVEAIRKNMHFGLDVVNKRIKFYATEKGIHMEGDKEIIERFDELLYYMNFTIYPDYNSARPCCWTDEYELFKSLLKSEYKLYYHGGGVRNYQNVLSYVGTFCTSVPNNIFKWNLYEPWAGGGIHPYEELAKKCKKVLVAEVVVLYFPDYEVFNYADAASQKKYTNYLKENAIILGDIKYGLSELQQTAVSKSRVILWNPPQ
jgi:hypothetical protein